MFGPGAYRPDPSEGITATADLPQPEIVPYSRNDKQNVCPRCGHVAYRDKQAHRTLKGARDLCRSLDLMKKQCVVGSTQLQNRCLLRQRIVQLPVA